jgi:hypothetical protein
MDLVAGDAADILLVIGLDDLAALDDRRRFTAHLALGSGLDPTWLDLFAEAPGRSPVPTGRPTSSTPGSSSRGRARATTARSSGSTRAGSAPSP